MGSLPKNVWAWVPLALAVCAAAQSPGPGTTIRSVSVLGAGNSLEVEIVGTGPLVPSAQAITGPDRLILDFPNALPSSQLHNIEVNRGELKSVRVGRFSANPPVTRVVLDLKSPQPYQLFPSRNSLIVKLKSSQNQIAAAPMAATPTPAAPVVVEKPAPKVVVSFTNGKLKIWADRATLAEVLAEVRHHTGAELSLPPGAGQEPIVADLGPAPPRDVLAALLNGSQFNFVMISSDRDPSQLRGIFLTPRGGSGPDNSMSYAAVTSSPPVQANPEPEPAPDQPAMEPETPPQPESPPATQDEAAPQQ